MSSALRRFHDLQAWAFHQALAATNEDFRKPARTPDGTFAMSCVAGVFAELFPRYGAGELQQAYEQALKTTRSDAAAHAAVRAVWSACEECRERSPEGGNLLYTPVWQEWTDALNALGHELPSFDAPPSSEASTSATREPHQPPGPSAPPLEETLDGPFPPDGFRWKDVEAQGFPPLQWRFLNALCEHGQLRQAVPLKEVIAYVYELKKEDHFNIQGKEEALAKLRSRVEERFHNAKLRLRVALINATLQLQPFPGTRKPSPE